jgi:hypothetical protein
MRLVQLDYFRRAIRSRKLRLPHFYSKRLKFKNIEGTFIFSKRRKPRNIIYLPDPRQFDVAIWLEGKEVTYLCQQITVKPMSAFFALSCK